MGGADMEMRCETGSKAELLRAKTESKAELLRANLS